MKTLIVILLLAVASLASAGVREERWYQDKWCTDGRTEVVMPDGTRCDCLTDTHAIEFDFGKKWSEAIGQSLNYAMQTNRRAGVVMILTRPKDRQYWIRMNSIIQHFSLPIDAWAVEAWRD